MSSSNRKLLENLSFQSIAEFAGKGLQAIYTIYLANVLGAEGNGVYGIATSTVSYFILFVSFGIDVYGSREVATDNKNVENNVSHIFSLRLLLAIIAYTILIVFTYTFIDDILVQFATLIIGINIFSNAILLNWVFQGLERMGIIAIRTILVSGLSLILVLLYVNGPEDTLLALGILSFSLLFNSVLMTIYYLSKVGKIKLSYNSENWKRIAKGSIPIGLFSIMVSIMNNIDLSLIGVLLTDYKFEAGIYHAAYKIVALAIVPSIIIQNAFFPQLSRANDSKSRNELYNKYSKAIHIVGALTAFITYFYSDFLISSLLNSEYQGSAILMKLFAFSIFIVFINVSLSSTLVAWKMEKLVVYATIYAVFMNIIIDILLIPNYGAYGATIATIIAEFTLLVALSYNLYKATNKVYLLNIFIVFVIGVVSILPSILYINDHIGNIVGIISTVILYILITHYSGFFRILDIKKILKT
jgi:O-antigen/teichoic acid export membrane protein